VKKAWPSHKKNCGDRGWPSSSNFAKEARNILYSELSALRSASAEDALRQAKDHFLEEKELLNARMSSLTNRLIPWRAGHKLPSLHAALSFRRGRP